MEASTSFEGQPSSVVLPGSDHQLKRISESDTRTKSHKTGSQQFEATATESDEESRTSAANEEESQVKRKRKYYTISVQNISEEFKWIDGSKNYLFCKICNIKLSGSRFHLKRQENNLNHKKGVWQ